MPALAVGFLAVAGTLTYAAVFQVARREISLPLTVGTGLGAVAMAVAALLAPGATAPDVWVGALLLVAAGLLFFAKSIDAGRRADRMLDGPDIAAAAATVAICGALARVAALAFPDAPLADGRRGRADRRARGAGAARRTGGAARCAGWPWPAPVVGVIAGWQALAGGCGSSARPGRIWDVRPEPATPAAAAPGAWQAPIALRAGRRRGRRRAAAARTRTTWARSRATLATIGAPAALRAALVVAAADRRRGRARLRHGRRRRGRSPGGPGPGRRSPPWSRCTSVGVGLVRPWSTAIALALVVIDRRAGGGAGPRRGRAAGARRTVADPRTTPTLTRPDDTGMPRHRAQIGGAATAGVLLAAARRARRGRRRPGPRRPQVVLTAALAALQPEPGRARRWSAGAIPQYLPWATVGLVGGATITALASVPTTYPTALYAAAAALLGVIAELLRGAVPAPGLTVAPDRYWCDRYAPPLDRAAARAGCAAAGWSTRPPAR